MSVDRGGLDYTIDVRNSGSAEVRQFREDIIKARTTWRAFKKDVLSLSRESRTMAQGLKTLATATREAANAANARTKASSRGAAVARKETGELAQQVEQVKRLSREERRAASERAQARGSRAALEREEVRAASRRLRVLNQELSVTKAINRAREKTAKNVALSSRDRGPTGETAQQKVKNAELTREAQLKATALELGKQKIIQQRAELAAAKTLLRVEEQRVKTQLLAAKGLDASGKPLAKPKTEAQLENERRLQQVERARLALAREKTIAEDVQLRELKKQLAVQAAINRAEQKQAVSQALEAAGLVTKKEKVVLTAQEAAQTRLKASQERVARDLLFEQMRAADGKLRSETAALAVQKAINRAKEKELATQLAATKGRNIDGSRILSPDEAAQVRFAKRLKDLQITQKTRELERNSKEWKSLQAQMGKADGVANRVSFTFRRLFGILAAFAFVRLAIGKFRELVTQGIDFNKQIELAELSISALFLATGEMRDAMGGAVDNTRQLALAHIEARRQAALLRKDALKTAATFDQLLDTFQVAIAPGRRAGLADDQIRTLAVRISQAATALGVAQNQLSEEIRSILAGTIQLRTTRIAAALGITNEDIRRAKEAGKLYEFLSNRFEAFATAGEEATKTMAGLSGRVNDALRQLVGAGTLGFFEELKGLLEDIFKGIIEKTPDGYLQPKPEAVKAVQQIGNGLKVAVDEARRLGKELDFTDAAGVFATIGAVLAGGARLLGAVIQGVVKGVRTLVGLVSALGRLLAPLGRLFKNIFPEDTAQNLLALLVQMVTVVLGLQIGFKILLFTFFKLIFPVTALVGAFKTLKTVSAALKATWVSIAALKWLSAGPWLLLVGFVIAIGVAFKEWLDDLAGMELSFQSVVDILKIALPAAMEIAVLKIKLAWAKLIKGMGEAWTNVKDSVSEFFTGKDNSLKARAAKQAKGEDAFVKALAPTLAGKKPAFGGPPPEDLVKDLKKELDDYNSSEIGLLEATIAQVEQDRNDRLAEILNKNDPNDKSQTLSGQIGDKIKGIVESIGGVLGIGGTLDDTVVKGEKLSEVFANMPGVIDQSRQGIEQIGNTVQKLKDDLDKAKDALQFDTASGALQGAVQSQLKELHDAQIAFRDQGKELSTQLKDAEGARNEILTRRLNLQRTTNSLTEKERKQVEAGVALGRESLTTQRKISKLETQITLSTQEAEAAREQGNLDLARSVEARKKGEEDSLFLLKQELEFKQGIADTIIDSSQEEATQKQILSLIREKILADGQLTVAEERILGVLADQAILADKLNQIALTKIALKAQEETRSTGIETRDLEARIAAERAAISARRELLYFDREIQAAQANLGPLKARREEIERINQLEESNLAALVERTRLIEVDLDARRKAAAGTEQEKTLQDQYRTAASARVALEAQLGAVRANNRAELENENLAITTQQEKLDALRQIAEAPVEFGIAKAFLDFGDQAMNQFQNAVDLMTNVLNGFVDLVSSSIVDAFDPTAKGDLKEKFARFLQSIATQILATLTKLAIAKATLNLFGGAGGTLAAAFGLHEGGMVPKKAGASLAHMTARGYRAGGRIGGRPGNVHPSDTVPIWSQPGEYMMRVAAVRKYGVQAMEALNRGLVDPATLAGLSGLNVRKPTAPSFADGGQITKAAAQATASAPSIQVLPVLTADEDSLDRMLSGGAPALLRWLRNNSSEVKASLGRN